MLPIAILVGYFAAVILAGSLLAYPVHLLDAAFEWGAGYEKVLSRSVVLASVAMLWPVFRFFAISLESVGLKPWRSVSLRRGEMLGVFVILPVAVLMFALEIRILDPRISITAGKFFSLVLMGGLAGLVVGFIEEVIFRGLIFSLLRESTHAVVASVFTSVLYALVHFLDVPERYHAVEIGWMSGFDYVGNAFATLAHPVEYWDSFVSLFLLGLALNWVRVRANLYWCVGIHAGFVMVIYVAKALSVRSVVNPYLDLIGSYDHFTGHLVSGWIVILATTVALWLLWRQRVGEKAEV